MNDFNVTVCQYKTMMTDGTGLDHFLEWLASKWIRSNKDAKLDSHLSDWAILHCESGKTGCMKPKWWTCQLKCVINGTWICKHCLIRSPFALCTLMQCLDKQVHWIRLELSCTNWFFLATAVQAALSNTKWVYKLIFDF